MIKRRGDVAIWDGKLRSDIMAKGYQLADVSRALGYHSDYLKKTSLYGVINKDALSAICEKFDLQEIDYVRPLGKFANHELLRKLVWSDFSDELIKDELRTRSSLKQL